jgi:glutaredoxin 3
VQVVARAAFGNSHRNRYISEPEQVSPRIEMSPVTIYTRRFCGYCTAAKALLAEKGVSFQEIDATGDAEKRKEMITRSGRFTFPQVFVGARHVGGYTDLYALDASGELDGLLSAGAAAA